MKSIWKGSIGFGLVNIPVKLYSAVQESRLDLDMLDERDHSRIKFQRINERTRKEIPYEKIVKGYSLNDNYVKIDQFKDEYSSELLKIIKAKAKGKRPSIKKLKPKKAMGEDLYEQLMQSLNSRKGA